MKILDKIDKNGNGVSKYWFRYKIEEILNFLNTVPDSGLSESDAEKRIEELGFNMLEEKKSKSPFKIFLSQFNDFMIWILIAAAIISGAIIREVTDAIVIIIILLINSVLGFVQEFRAEKALQALKEMAAPEALVLRNGTEKRIASRFLVPGDIIRLSSGDLVPADCRIITQVNLQTIESMLTGESLPAEKNEKEINKETLPLGDRRNMLFSGTMVVKGRCSAVVIATGKDTEIGKIASLVQEKDEMTPLQLELKTVGARIGIICLAVSAVVFAAGILKGFGAISTGLSNLTRMDVISDMFLVAVALAVASIPEGLPAIVTISLALGVQRMAKNNAIVRRLSSVETLGSVSVICTDKTGTLTQNKMLVKKIFTGLKEYDDYEKQHGGIDTGNTTEPAIKHQTKIPQQKTALKFLVEGALLCNDAYYMNGQGSKIAGDPTEAALIELASFYSLEKDSLEFILPREFEEPFDSERKMMTTVHRISDMYTAPMKVSGHEYIVFCKGAPESIIKRCSKIISDDTVVEMSENEKKQVMRINTGLASNAMRNLAFAFKYITSIPDSGKITELENDLIFAGLVGMIDPPRPEVYDAVEKCKAANINIIMVTGDHKLTARAIGTELGILEADGKIVDEEELSLMTGEQLQSDIENIKVFARVSPQHKVDIVDALRKNGHIVAMTGDGINDAPSLKKADIGLAMGITGTDVSKEASDMILTDDNFATIVKAIKEGRVIYDNLKKFILFLLSCNISEVLIMFITIVFGSYVLKLLGMDPALAYIPLLPVQILWMNLITDGFPALALGINPSEPNIMQRKATKNKERILSRARLFQILWQGLILTFGALFMYFIGPLLFNTHTLAHDTDIFHTCVFTTLVFSQLFHSYNFRFEDKGILRTGIFGNKFLNISIILSILLQVALIYVPFLQTVFRTASLNILHWAAVLTSSIIPVLIINLINEIVYLRNKRNGKI
jgi:P-type Ca2+ transporter type 2C